jgi:hypothetical protein
MVAHVVRYEVGRPENAESFVDQALAQFDALQARIPNLRGSFLLTRRAEGEALALFLFDTPDEADSAAAHFEDLPAPDTGAREVWAGRRVEEIPTATWDVWQGRQEYRTD